MLGVVVAAPLALALVIARRCLSAGLTINAATVDEDAEILTSARRVRREVFCAEQRVPVEMERDATASHRRRSRSLPCMKTSRPGTSPSCRGRRRGARRRLHRKAPRQDRAPVCVLRDHRRWASGAASCARVWMR